MVTRTPTARKDRRARRSKVANPKPLTRFEVLAVPGVTDGPTVIDAEEFEQQTRDPRVREVHERADKLGAQLRAQGRIDSLLNE